MTNRQGMIPSIEPLIFCSSQGLLRRCDKDLGQLHLDVPVPIVNEQCYEFKLKAETKT